MCIVLLHMNKHGKTVVNYMYIEAHCTQQEFSFFGERFELRGL